MIYVGPISFSFLFQSYHDILRTFLGRHGDISQLYLTGNGSDVRNVLMQKLFQSIVQKKWDQTDG